MGDPRPNSPTGDPRTLALARGAFAAYALGLAVATHWPALVITSQRVARADLYVHALTFGGWATLLTMSGFFGRPLSARNIRLSALSAMGYAVIDELTQGIPGLQRSVDPLDLVADGAGIALAALALGVWAATRRGATAPVTAGDSSDR